MKFDEIFDYGDEGPGPWMWCLHCERMSPTEDWEANDLGCPRDGCDGGFLDAWTWRRLREIHPDYPETPEEGRRYPLYPPTGKRSP
jgi:hypothetical protein